MKNFELSRWPWRFFIFGQNSSGSSPKSQCPPLLNTHKPTINFFGKGQHERQAESDYALHIVEKNQSLTCWCWFCAPKTEKLCQVVSNGRAARSTVCWSVLSLRRLPHWLLWTAWTYKSTHSIISMINRNRTNVWCSWQIITIEIICMISMIREILFRRSTHHRLVG